MITLKDINKRYGDKVIFENFNLAIDQNKSTVILGESGSGKTTLVKIIMGLTDFDGSAEGVGKDFAVVFQNNVLAPNLTVKENLTLVNPTVDAEKALETVGLLEVKNDYVKTLSAGMARRVAIARALCVDAPILILDEPFINLDLALKYSLMEKIRNIAKEKNQTVIMITHDVAEASYMADRVIALSGGKVIYDKECDFSKREKTQKQLFKLMIGQNAFGE